LEKLILRGFIVKTLEFWRKHCLEYTKSFFFDETEEKTLDSIFTHSVNCDTGIFDLWGHVLNPVSWDNETNFTDMHAQYAPKYLSKSMGLTPSESDGLMTMLLATSVISCQLLGSCDGFDDGAKMKYYMSKLPKSQGIYFFSLSNRVYFNHTCLDGTLRQISLDCSFPIYIGKSCNLKGRMIDHHRMPAFDLLIKCGQKVYFRYFAENSFIKLSDIDMVERTLIKCFNPCLNGENVGNYSRPDNNIETLPRVNLSPILSVV